MVQIKEEIAYFMQRMYNRGLISSLSGNISCRINEKKIAISGSQTDKARISKEEIGEVDMEGNVLSFGITVSMETKMHLTIYSKRKDVSAIIHAHPPFSTFFAVTDHKLNNRLSGESRMLIGEPSYAPYALMGTKELSDVVAQCTINSNVIFLKNHGLITLGRNLLEAFDRLEVAEYTSRLTLLTILTGNSNELTEEELKAIDLLTYH
jgi:L-fuculose-phosphate aldolase